MSKPYEYFEHTADIGIRASAESVEDCFAIAAGAMFDIITDDSPVNAAECVSITADAIDTEGLLVDFLSKLIVVHEVDNMVFTKFDISIDSPTRLTAVCHGERFDKERHRSGHHVKGVSYHMMQIAEAPSGSGYMVQVLFDV